MEFRETFEDCEIGDAVLLETAIRDGLIEPKERFEIEKIPVEGGDDFAWVRKS
jgi:hypothetical protein